MSRSHIPNVINEAVKSVSILSGGSSVSWSVTAAAETVKGAGLCEGEIFVGVQRKIGWAIAMGNCVFSAVRAGYIESSRGHIHRLAKGYVEVWVSSGRLDAPSTGMEPVTAGAESATQLATWVPKPSNVLMAYPSHSRAGSKTSEPFGSPLHTVFFRLRVLSAVLVRPVPHSVPGSNPACPDHI